MAGADPVGGDTANNPVEVAAGTDASGEDAAAIAARAKQAKRAKVGTARGISTLPASKSVDSMIRKTILAVSLMCSVAGGQHESLYDDWSFSRVTATAHCDMLHFAGGEGGT